jgi:NADH dehydrogenase/NADH:ubiquinone oxidoreductase subunit G
MGPSTAASKESITSIYQAMGSTEKLSTNTMKVFIKLNTYAGMSAESLVKFQKFAKLGTQDAGKMVTTMANTALQVIKTNKLAISQKGLLDEVANVSSIVRLRFAAQPKELVKAVAATKALGLDMEKVKSIADGLLNIEDSIAAEMEAELLTGKDLNLEKARELALAGKSEEAAKLIADQMGGAAEFSKLNVVQQESLAKVLGMNRDGMADMLAAQEENKNVNGDLVAGQKDGLKAMMSGVSEAEKNANLERSRQEASIAYYQTLSPLVQKISDTFTKIKSTLNGLFNDLVVKPMTDWAKSPAGQEFLEKLPGYAERFSKGVTGAVKSFVGLIKENPWILKVAGLAAGGALAIKGVKGLMSMFGMKRDGSSKS